MGNIITYQIPTTTFKGFYSGVFSMDFIQEFLDNMMEQKEVYFNYQETAETLSKQIANITFDLLNLENCTLKGFDLYQPKAYNYTQDSITLQIETSLPAGQVLKEINEKIIQITDFDIYNDDNFDIYSCISFSEVA